MNSKKEKELFEGWEYLNYFIGNKVFIDLNCSEKFFFDHHLNL